MYSVIPWPWCRDGVAVTGVAVAGVVMVFSPLIENKPKSLPLFCLLTFFIIGPAFVFCWCCCDYYCGAGAAWAALLFSVRRIYSMLGFFRLPLIASISEF